MTRAELLELLKKARKQLKKYKIPKNEQTVMLSIDELENALSEQPQIVRCKDCKHYHVDLFAFCDLDNRPQHENWYCADGERKDEPN